MKKLSIVLIVLLFSTASMAAVRHHLSTEDIEEARMIKQMLGTVDKKSLDQFVDELEKTDHPHLNLQLREAMAKTYVDIVRDHQVEGQEKKEWLYSMISLNMAYLQFGGTPQTARHADGLNRLILQKLKAYLPADIIQQSGFTYDLE